MRQPISINHEKRQYQVIFRRRGGIQNWTAYIEAETPEDAKREARFVLAHDRHSDAGHMSINGKITNDRDWIVVEVNPL